MASSGEYYNEMYAPIQDDYMAEQARIDQESRNLSEANEEGMEMTQNTRRQKRLSRYDENNYALPDIDEDSSPPTSPTNSSPEVVVTTPKEIAGNTKTCGWKYKLISCCVVLLVGASSILAYFYTKSHPG